MILYRRLERYKIALVSDWYLPRVGGLEMQMHGLARALAALGHEVHVYTTTPGEEAASPDGIVVHRLKLARIAGVVFNPWNLLLARRTMREEDFDVVHGHGLFSMMTIGVLMSARALKVPCVLTSHSLLRGGAFPAAVLALAFDGRTDVIAGVSRAAADDLARASGRRDVIVLPNGIEPSEWATADDRALRTPRVTSVMRLSRKKNGVELIEAMARVVERVSSIPAPRLTIVGDGPDRTRLERRVDRLGLGDVVEFLGWQDRRRIADVLAASTVFALPCRREAFGLAALEARCAGVPVVAMHGGGIGEIVEDGRHGYLAATHNAFADAIALLLMDRDRRAEMSRAARSGLDRFTWNEVVRAHLQAYRLAMSRRARLRPRVAA